MLARRVPLLLALALAGCGSPIKVGRTMNADADMAVDPLAGLQSIEVMPPSATIATGDVPGVGSFIAIGHYQDGHTWDVSAAADWSLGNPSLGSATGGHLVLGMHRGGATTVSATIAAITGSAQLNVVLTRAVVLATDGSTAPAGSQAMLAGTTEDPTLAPTLVYPQDGTLVPSNLGAIEIQWTPPAKPTSLYEVSIESAILDYQLYTNAVMPAGGRLFLTGADWADVSSTIAGSAAAVTVRALSTADPTKSGTAKSIQLMVGADDVEGGIYYWSATSGANTEGVVRHAFGDVTDTAAPFYTQSMGYLQPGGTNHCVACHVLTRDGTKMAVTYDGGDGVAGLIDVASETPIIGADKGLHWNFASFSPDGTKFIGSSHGVLTFRDSTTGAALGTLPVPNGALGTHPDWSPDGTQIVFVATTNYQYDWEFQQGSILLATDTGNGTFAVTRTLVTSAGENNYYPSFSPDQKWILFNRSHGNAYNNADARLWVMPADGSAPPLMLTGIEGAGTVNLSDSWGRWSPFVEHDGPNGDLLYLTFSSQRTYGIELAANTRPQIWMAAFSPNLGKTALPPTAYSPFWLPFQDLTTANHIAQWTQQIVGVQ